MKDKLTEMNMRDLRVYIEKQWRYQANHKPGSKNFQKCQRRIKRALRAQDQLGGEVDHV